MGNVFHKSGAVSHRPSSKTKGSSSQGKEVEFIREIVEQLVDNVPQKSEIRRESNTGSSLSSTECFTDLLQVEDSRKSQETETDITEYESAADTDFSDKVTSSPSLLTFSEQLLQDIENGSFPSSPVVPEPVDDQLDRKENDLVKHNIPIETYVEEDAVIDASPHITELPSLTSQSHEQLVLPIISKSSVIPKPEESNFPSPVRSFDNLHVDSVSPDNINLCPTDEENELSGPLLLCKNDSCDNNSIKQSIGLPDDSELVNKYSETLLPLDEGTISSPSDVQHEPNIIVLSSKEESFNNVLLGKDIDLFTNLESENKYVTLDKYPNLNVVSTHGESDVIINNAGSISTNVTSDTFIKDLPEKLQESFSTEDPSDKSINEQHIVLDLECTETVPKSEHSFDSNEIIPDVVSEDFSFVSQEASKVAQEISDAFETLDDIDEDSASLKMSSASNLASQDKDLNMKDSEATNSINEDFYHEDSLRSTHKLSNSPQPNLVKEEDALGSISQTEKNAYAKTCDMDHVAEASKVKDGSAVLRAANSATVCKDAESYDILSTKGNVKPGNDIRRGLLQSESEKPHCEESVSLKGAIDENDNARKADDEKNQTYVKNQALEGVNKLLSQFTLLRSSSSNNGNQTSQKGADNSVSDLPCEEMQQIQEQLLQLRNVIYEQDAVNKEEVKKCQSRMKNVEEREHQLARRMSENSLGQQQMSLILEEYEKTISRLVAEKEHERQTYDMEKENLIKDKDTISGHLSNIEIAFSDVHQKYEKSKQVIQGFKNNEEALRATVSEYEAALKKQEQKYEILKSHAMNQLESANQELIAMRRNHEAENSKLKAMLKKAEIKIHSLEETLQQKVKENQELVNICDELIGKVGSSE